MGRCKIYTHPPPTPPVWRDRWRGAHASQPQSLYKATCLRCRCVWSSFGKHRHRADKTCLGPCAGSLWRHQFPLLGCPHIGFILVVPGGENGIKHSDRRSSLVCKQMPLTTTDHLVTSMGSQARGSFNWKWRKEDQVRSESPHVHPIIPGTLMCPYDGHTYYTPASSHSPRLA